MLNVLNLTKYYDGMIGVENINFEVEKGEILGLLGLKNAGKTTILESILCLIPKDSGIVLIDGESISKMSKKIKNKVGYLPNQIIFDSSLTVQEVLDYSKKFYEQDLTDRINYLTKKLKINTKTKIASLSHLAIKKVGIVVALMNEVPLLILDDPFDSLDSVTKEILFELLEEEKKKGTSILLSSDNLCDARKICDKVAILKNGRLLAVEDVDKLFSENAVMITLVSDDYKKLKLPIKSVKIKKRTEDTLKFLYCGNIQDFLDLMKEIRIRKLRIEEPTLEEIFTPLD